MFQVVDPRLAFVGNKVTSTSFANYVGVNLFSTFRLDCDFYGPTFIDNDSKQLRSPHPRRTLGELSARLPNGSPALSDGIHDTIEKLGGYQVSGYRLITSGEIANGFDSQGVHITNDAHRRNMRSEVIGGDLLVAVRGSTSVGVARVYPEHMPTANMNTASARVRLTDAVDAYWVAGFLNSYVGRINSLRLANGVNQLNMNMEELAAVPILLPPIEIQRLIGNKIRKAERLHAIAMSSRDQATRLIANALPALPSSKVNRCDWIDSSTLAQRLDPKYYKANYLAARRSVEAIANGQRIADIVQRVSNGAEIRRYVDHGRPYLCVASVDHGCIDIASNPMISFSESVPQRAIGQPGDVLVVRSGNTVAQAVNLLEEECRPEPAISSHFIALRLYDPKRAGFVSAFLNSSIGVALQLQIAYGAVQPQIGQDDLLDIPFPQFEYDLEAEVATLNYQWRRYSAESRSQLMDALKAIEQIVQGEDRTETWESEGRAISAWLQLNAVPFMPETDRR